MLNNYFTIQNLRLVLTMLFTLQKLRDCGKGLQGRIKSIIQISSHRLSSSNIKMI